MEMLTQLVRVNNIYSRAPLDHELRDRLVARGGKRKPRAKD